jgi:hypothetical protein
MTRADPYSGPITCAINVRPIVDGSSNRWEMLQRIPFTIVTFRRALRHKRPGLCSTQRGPPSKVVEHGQLRDIPGISSWHKLPCAEQNDTTPDGGPCNGGAVSVYDRDPVVCCQSSQGAIHQDGWCIRRTSILILHAPHAEAVAVDVKTAVHMAIVVEHASGPSLSLCFQRGGRPPPAFASKSIKGSIR